MTGTKKIIIAIVVIIAVGGLAVASGIGYYYYRLYQAVNPADVSTNQLTCGGIAGLECPEGYVCRYSTAGPSTDNAGVCLPVAE